MSRIGSNQELYQLTPAWDLAVDLCCHEDTAHGKLSERLTCAVPCGSFPMKAWTCSCHCDRSPNTPLKRQPKNDNGRE